MEFAEGKIDGDVFTAKLSGHIDSASAPKAEAALKELTAGKEIKKFVIDAENLDYISSAGLRVVLAFKKAYPDFKVVNVKSEVYEIFDMTGFTQMVGTAFHYFAEHPEREAHLAVISSIAGTKGLGAAPSYSSSKRYIAHYMECLEQLCHIRHLCHIHLHDIRPGFVRTALLADGHHYPVQLDPHKVALSIAKGIRRNCSVITIDWRYRVLVFFWRWVPRWVWVRMRIVSGGSGA